MKKILWTLLGAFILAGAAIYNGFPMVTSDTGTYIYSGFNLSIPVDRPIAYGLFIRHSSLATSLWFTIIAQCLILAFLFWQTMDYLLSASLGKTSKLFVLIFLVLFSSISWYSGQVMPDVFTSMGVLAVCLLLLADQSVFNKILTVIFLLMSCMVHNSNLIIFLMLTVLIVPVGIYLKTFRKKNIRWKNYLIVFMTMVSSWFLSATINYSIDGKFKLSGNPHAFLLAKNVETGLVDRYLADSCKNFVVSEIKDSMLCFISPVHSKKMLDIRDNSMNDFGIAHQWEYTGGDNQQFYIVKAGKDCFRIVCKKSGKCLEPLVKDSTQAPRIVQKTISENPAQLFRFEHALGTTDMWWIIHKETGKRMDVINYEKANWAEMTLYDSTGAANQIFKMVKGPNCLCLYQGEIPHSAMTFLWDNTSPFYGTGFFENSETEYNKILKEIYLGSEFRGRTISEAFIATMRQLLSNEIGDGVQLYGKGSSPYVAIQENLGNEIKPYENGRPYINFTEINKRHYWLLIFSLITVIVFFRVKGLRQSISDKMVLFIWLSFLGIVCNAFVTGALANVYNRLQCRIVWLLPLIALLLVFNYFAPQINRLVSKVNKDVAEQ